MKFTIVLLGILFVFALAFSYETDYTAKAARYHKAINQCTLAGNSLCRCLELNYPNTYIDIPKIRCEKEGK